MLLLKYYFTRIGELLFIFFYVYILYIYIGLALGPTFGKNILLFLC